MASPLVVLPEHLSIPMLQTHLEMVFRNRSRNQLRPVHRIKHVVDSQFAAALGVAVNLTLVNSKDAPILSAVSEVETGSTVNGIYLKVEVYATSAGALANAYMLVMKNPGGNLSIPPANAVGSDDNKKYVIHQEMVMLEKSVDGNPRTLFNGVIVIPRGYRRMAINDLLQLRVFSPGVNLDVCVQCHYKEFR